MAEDVRFSDVIRTLLAVCISIGWLWIIGVELRAQLATSETASAPSINDHSGKTDVATWSLVAVGIVTFIVIGWQAWETRRSANTSERMMLMSNQPKLIVRGIARTD